MSPHVDCEDCAWSRDADDLLEASDRAEEHEAKEHHRVSIERVATDGGSDVDRCPNCGDEFAPDPTGRRDRTELNLGKPAGFCSLGCRLEANQGAATDGGRDYAWVVSCPHDERIVVEDDLEAAALDWSGIYDVTIAGWDDPPSPRPIATDGGTSDSEAVADEIEAELCSRLWEADRDAIVVKGGDLAEDLDVPVGQFSNGLAALREREDARVEIERWIGQGPGKPWEVTLAEEPAIADGGQPSAGSDRLDRGKLANLIEDHFEVSFEEASALADAALESDWQDGGPRSDGGAPGGAAAPPETVDEMPWDERVHSEEDLYRDAEMEWGVDAQMAKAAEELAELSAVCARDLNRQADGQVLLEELVDARIMIEQVAYQIDDDRLEETVEEKLAQLHARLSGGDGDE